MSALGLYGWNDFVLAIVIGVLFLTQLVLFVVVGCAVIVPVWLLSFWGHSPLQHPDIG